MNRFHRMILVGLLAAIFFINLQSHARAQALEIVFKNSLWGSALGLELNIKFSQVCIL